MFSLMFRSIYQQEGLFALWRGVGATVVGVMPSRAIYFACYNQGKHIFTDLNHGKESSLVHVCSAVTAGKGDRSPLHFILTLPALV